MPIAFAAVGPLVGAALLVAASTALSRELKRLGFTFVGPTIAYALMQAARLVNDHLVACPRESEVAALAP